MQATWVWDKPGFNHLTAECRVADMCAQSPSINPPDTVVCGVEWTIAQDLFVLFRGQSQTTCTVLVYKTLADAQAQNANWIGKREEDVLNLLVPHDFSIGTAQGTPNVFAFHVATVAVDLTPSNPTWSVWKIPGVAPSADPDTAPFFTDFADPVTRGDGSTFNAIFDKPYAKALETEGSAPSFLAAWSDVGGVRPGDLFTIHGQLYAAKGSPQQDVDRGTGRVHLELR